MKELDRIGWFTINEDRVKNSSPTSQIKYCELVIIEACNFKCPYCNGLPDIVYGSKSKKMMSLQQMKDVIDIACTNIPLLNIRFTGGEPTLHPDLKEAVAYAKAKGVERIAVSTNGFSDLQLYKDLVSAGVNDFSISLDSCCATKTEEMSGGIKGVLEKVSSNIRELSKLVYVSVGIVVKEDAKETIDTILFADSLGVHDMRLVSASQWDQPISAYASLSKELLDKYPILKYRAENFAKGMNIRTMSESDCKRCHLMTDEFLVAGEYHYPCAVYMREKGNPIGKVGPNMRADRIEWSETHDTFSDPICRSNCMDFRIEYNNKFVQLRTRK